MLADRLGMSSYQHSADIAGKFVGSGAGCATLRDYAKSWPAVDVNDGVWNGERLLPPGWVDYANCGHAYRHVDYAACFRHQHRPSFPLPAPRNLLGRGSVRQPGIHSGGGIG